MAAFNRPTEATYEIHDEISVETSGKSKGKEGKEGLERFVHSFVRCSLVSWCFLDHHNSHSAVFPATAALQTMKIIRFGKFDLNLCTFAASRLSSLCYYFLTHSSFFINQSMN